MISPHNETFVLVKTSTLSLSEDRDYIFEPTTQVNLILFAHLIDSKITEILVRNDSDHQVEIPRKLRLGVVTEINYENCFQADLGSEYASTVPSKKFGWLKKVFAIVAMAVPFLVNAPQSTSKIVNFVDSVLSSFSVSIVGTVLAAGEIKLQNEVTVYGDEIVRKSLGSLIEEFSTLWIDKGFVDIPQEEWMKLSLKSDWESRLGRSGGKAKVYPLGLRDR